MRKVLAALMFLALAGCARPTHDEATLRKISAESMALLRTTAAGEIPRAKWPATIKSLEPEQVMANRGGLYVVMSMHFDAESGYFVPRDGNAPVSSPGFIYSALGPGVYWYDAN
jgi:hypothetical protein